ncbi:MAG: response regulator [Bacteroidales bacterium]
MQKKLINVLVVDDHQLIIEGLRSILQDEDYVAFAGGVNNLADALAFLENHEVHVALVDISMPDHSGVEVTKIIKEKYPDVKVLALTMHEDISTISAMIDAGASGYLLKRTNMNEVLDAIRVAASNRKYLGLDVQAIMMEEFHLREQGSNGQEDSPAKLTGREKEILNLVAREYSNEEIAKKLFISERTVETHRRNILIKTDTKSIIGLIKYAIRHGLITNENEEFMHKNDIRDHATD